MDLIAIIKAGWATLIGWTSSVLFYFLPIMDLIYGLLIAFALSFLVGIIAGVRVQNESVSKDKAFVAFKEVAIYLVILASLFVIGDRMNSHDFIYQVMSTITWGLIYFYFISSMKNLSRLNPQSKGLRYIYFVIDLQFLKRTPTIMEFEKIDNQNNNTDGTESN